MGIEKIKQKFNEKKQDLVWYIMYYFRDKWDEKINGWKRIDNWKMIRLWDETHETVGIDIDKYIDHRFCERFDIDFQVSHNELIKMIDEIFVMLLKRFSLEDINVYNRDSKEREINEWVKVFPWLYASLFLKIK